MELVQYFVILAMIMIMMHFNQGLEICVTTTSQECKCTNDGRIVLCTHSHLQTFPIFNKFFMDKAEELHLAYNNISAWPNQTIWEKYLRITYIDVTHNPVCKLPTLQKHIEIDISPYKYTMLLNYLQQSVLTYGK